jgi:murein DD-endopeptidase MepM/ murein hydrolase activator NlpD
MRFEFLACIVLLWSVSVIVHAQRSSHRTSPPQSRSTGVHHRERQLFELQRSIQQREQIVKQLAEQERSAAKAVNQLRQLIERQQRYLRLLDGEIRALDEQLHSLKVEYQRYGSIYHEDYEQLRRLVLLLLSADLRDDAEGELDTGVISAALRTMGRRLLETQQRRDSTDRALQRLEQYRAARQLLLVHQKREQQRLERMLTLREQLLEKLRRDRQAVTDELQALRKSLEAIKQSMKRLSREERVAHSNEKSAASTGTIDFRAFRSPVQGAILRGYGEYRHPLTGARAFNPGIDIAVPVGTPVVAAAAGKVVSIRWLPAMNTVVIVEHSDGIRTVYGNLERATVRQGQRVGAGESLGSSGETLSGAFVHFELWRGVERLNPTTIVR